MTPVTDERLAELIAWAELLAMGSAVRVTEKSLPNRIEIVAALRELLSLRRSQWQPIESAPKDGTRVMLAVILTHPQQVGQEAQFYQLCSWTGDNWSPFIPNKWTHWQPLPSPPKDGV